LIKSEIVETYIYNIVGEGEAKAKGQLIPASEWQPTPSSSARAPPARPALVGALVSVGPAEAGGEPNGAGGCAGRMRLQEQGARGVGGPRAGKSKERAAQDKGTRGKMAATANVEWGGLTTARRCEACDGQVSRKIFLREVGRCTEEAGLIGR
jgi:hypothetical protein